MTLVDKHSFFFAFFRSFGCVIKKYQYERASVPGQFTYFSARESFSKDN